MSLSHSVLRCITKWISSPGSNPDGNSTSNGNIQRSYVAFAASAKSSSVLDLY
jgi:hypothetical protein